MNILLLRSDQQEAAGTEQQYYRDLARELAEFLLKPLNVAGGTMPLTDVYCVYNRARGSNVCDTSNRQWAWPLF